MLKKIFGKHQDDYFISMLQVAAEDIVVGEQLLQILELPTSSRASAVERLAEQMNQDGAPKEFIDAILELKADDRANAARATIKNFVNSDS